MTRAEPLSLGRLLVGGCPEGFDARFLAETLARAAGPVIHWLTPLASAVVPSSEAATFMRTQGRPVAMRCKKPTFSSRLATANGWVTGSTSTCTPAARSRAKP